MVCDATLISALVRDPAHPLMLQFDPSVRIMCPLTIGSRTRARADNHIHRTMRIMIRQQIHVFLFLGVLSAGLTGCFEAPKEAVAPTTDVQLSMPLADRTYLIGDFADDQNVLTPLGNEAE